MAENTTNRSSRFGTGLVIYVLIFLILSAAGLIFFYDWLAAYEATRPIYAVQAYEAQLRSTGLGAETVARLRAVDHEVQSDAEIKASADAILREATLIKSSAQSTGDRQAYQVRAGGNVLGTVYFEAKGEKKFNLLAWIPTEEDYDFSAYLESLSKGETKMNTSVMTPYDVAKGYIEARPWNRKNPEIDEAIEEAVSKGVVVVAAAGNQGGDTADRYPANKDNVLTITSVDSSDKIAENANTGADVDFALPGVLILAPYKRLMMVDSGTSLAAPHAAAAAALLKSWCKHLNQDQVVDILKQYSVDLGAKGFDNTYGWGMINLSKFNVNATPPSR